MFKCSYLLALILMTTPINVLVASEMPETAEYCGNCHRAIEQGWKESVHSQAMESRLFQDALQLAKNDLGPHARNVCLGCHSPTIAVTRDLGLVRKVSWEGITCDY